MTRTVGGWLLALAVGVVVMGAWAASEIECAGLAESSAMPATPAPFPSVPTDSELDPAPGDWPAITF